MGISLVSKKVLHLLVLHFLPLIITPNPDGGEKDWFQNVAAIFVCSVPGRNTVASGAGMVAAVGVALQTVVGAASRIALC